MLSDRWCSFYYAARQGRERVNHHAWEPAGALATEVLQWSSEPHGATLWAPSLRSADGAALSPSEDAKRLEAALRRRGGRLGFVPSPKFEWAVEVPRLSAAFPLWLDEPFPVEKGFEPDPFDHPWAVPTGTMPALPACEVASMTTVRQAVERRLGGPDAQNNGQGRAGSSLLPPGLEYWHHSRPIDARDGLWLLAAPTTLVYCSADAGIAAGTLRQCADCGRFITSPRGGFQRRFCRECLAFRRADGECVGVPPALMPRLRRWRLVSARVRRRFSRRRLPAKHWRAWQSAALRALYTTDDLDGWEAAFAPEEPRGRPKQGPRRPDTEARGA